MPALAWAGQVLAGQRFAAGPDGVQGVAFGAVAAAWPLGPADLDHPLAMVDSKLVSPAP
jgi:threonine/homoserine efflux transporter RhtA